MKRRKKQFVYRFDPELMAIALSYLESKPFELNEDTMKLLMAPLRVRRKKKCPTSKVRSGSWKN